MNELTDEAPRRPSLAERAWTPDDEVVDEDVGEESATPVEPAAPRPPDDVEPVEDLRPTVDTNGWEPQQRDLDYLGQRREQLEWLEDRRALMGMTPEEYDEFNAGMLDALARDGVDVDEVDRRAQGSAAHYYSSDYKRFDLAEIEANPTARARLEEWFGDDRSYPEHHMFDSRYELGLTDERSDYDLNLSSSAMVERAREVWEARAEAGKPFQGDFFKDHGYVNKDAAKQAFPSLHEWSQEWGQRLGRDVSYAVFESSGPRDTSRTGNGVSVHHRDTDWIMRKPEDT